MRNIILVILVTLLTACSGEAFSTAEPQLVAGDAGMGTDAEAGEAGAVTSQGGSGYGGGSGAAGKTSVGGSASAGSASAAGSGGTPATACDLDLDMLTKELPASFTWRDFFMSTDNVCGSCSYDPCATLKATWGTPEVDGNLITYQVTLAPLQVPLTINVGDGGSCVTKDVCDVHPKVSVTLSKTRSGEGWFVVETSVSVDLTSDGCLDRGSTGQLAAAAAHDLEQELASSVPQRQIACK